MNGFGEVSSSFERLNAPFQVSHTPIPYNLSLLFASCVEIRKRLHGLCIRTHRDVGDLL